MSKIISYGTLPVLLMLFACKVDPQERIEQIFADYQDQRPGASVLVIKDGQPIVKSSFGMASLEH